MTKAQLLAKIAAATDEAEVFAVVSEQEEAPVYDAEVDANKILIRATSA